jgi:hypothetical protein
MFSMAPIILGRGEATLNTTKLLCCIGLLLLLAALPAGADNGADAAAPTDSSALELAGAYQGGYLAVVGTACFQLYSSMGIIASDLSAGHITNATALSALEQNGLLLSVCQDSLEEIRNLTSAADPQGAELLGRIAGVLEALSGLHSALVDAASAPRTDKAAQRTAVQAVETSRQQVEAALDAYAAPL